LWSELFWDRAMWHEERAAGGVRSGWMRRGHEGRLACGRLEVGFWWGGWRVLEGSVVGFTGGAGGLGVGAGGGKAVDGVWGCVGWSFSRRGMECQMGS